MKEVRVITCMQLIICISRPECFCLLNVLQDMTEIMYVHAKLYKKKKKNIKGACVFGVCEV